MEDITRLAIAGGAGDQVALTAFVRASYDDVRRLCAFLVDEPSADDLAQETFVRALRSLPRFRAESGARTWLLTIARRTCADELRSRIRRRRRDRELAESSPESVASDPADRIGTMDLIRRLEPQRREAFVLTQLLQLSYDQAAGVCGVPRGTIHSRVARARDDLIAMTVSPAQSAGEAEPQH